LIGISVTRCKRAPVVVLKTVLLSFYLFLNNMSLIIKCVTVLLASTLFCNAQPNLVPNGDFEYFTACPSGQGQINLAFPWFQPNLLGSSSDYFNLCGTNQFGIPGNTAGYQLPKTGNGYAGIEIYTAGFNSREYLEVKMIDSLKQGFTYCAGFYISVSEDWKTPSDGIGMYFSNDSVTYSSPSFGVLNFLPQVQNLSGNLISDTVNWILIQNEFVAAGGEQYITIGNFKDDSHTNTSPPNVVANSYIYIDDVSVIEGSCSVGINDSKAKQTGISVYPNPAINFIYIELPTAGKCSIAIYNVTGQLIFSDAKAKSKMAIDCSSYPAGLYFIKAQGEDGKIITAKFVKQ
jgi:hypothetical protein